MQPYYERNGIVLYHGDCRDVLESLGNDVADCMITDPPYGVKLKGKRAKFSDSARSTFRAGEYETPDTPEYLHDVIVPVVRALIPVVRAAALTPGIRNMFLYPQPDDVGGFVSKSATGVGRWGFTIIQPILFYGSDPFLRTRRGSRANSVIGVYPNDANHFDHPCVKPIRPWTWLVERASLPGERILDPFAGAGTTLVAAVNTGRYAIGIEIDERHCETTAKRVDDAIDALEIAS